MAVAAELTSCPYDTLGRVDHAAGLSVQALRRYTARDERSVLPWVSAGEPGHRVVLVGDLRLDETAALARRLGLSPDAADPELVVGAYRRFGSEVFAAELLGDFAFALIDETARSLVLVRDAMGIRPLYLAQLGSLVLAASDVAILAEHPLVDITTDDQVLAEWLLYGHVWHPTRTFFLGIAKLPRARADVFGVGSRREHVFWTPPKRAPIPREEYVSRLATLLPEAVACRVDPIHPVAAHNSGGFDSGVLATLTARLAAAAGKPAYSYNWTRPSREWELSRESAEEWEPARRIAAEAGMQHVEVGFTAEDSSRLLTSFDIARLGTTMFEYETKVLDHAAAHGVRQIVSGYGGDELITGHYRARVSDLAMTGHIKGAWGLYASKHRQRSTWGRAARFLPAIAREAAKGRPNFEDLEFPKRRRDLAIPILESRRPLEARDFDEFQRSANRLMAARTLRTWQIAQLDVGHLPERLETWSSLGRRAGVRHDFPLLDTRLVALAIGGMVDGTSDSCRDLYTRATRQINPSLWTPQISKATEPERVRALAASFRVSIEACLKDQNAIDFGWVHVRLVREIWTSRKVADDLADLSLLRDVLMSLER